MARTLLCQFCFLRDTDAAVLLMADVPIASALLFMCCKYQFIFISTEASNASQYIDLVSSHLKCSHPPLRSIYGNVHMFIYIKTTQGQIAFCWQLHEVKKLIHLNLL